MLVDIFCDNVIFSAQQGAEMRTIFKEVFSKYTYNESRMYRYADRRRKKESFKLNNITTFRGFSKTINSKPKAKSLSNQQYL
tara:strand:- start:121 stop:366 length:246 start_codon:yes stop_codon:yes gene_type:complete